MTALSLDVKRNDNGHVVVVVAGEIDMATAPQLDDCLRSLPPADTVVDLAGVSFIDSSGLTVIVNQRQRLAAEGLALQVHAATDHVRRVFEITGLGDYLDPPHAGVPTQ